MKLMVMGYARHGKDTVCEILRDDYGLTFVSSSIIANAELFTVLRDVLGYQTHEEAFEDRHNHRALWYELIKAYNYRAPSRLARHIFAQCDIYCGIRNREEFFAAKHEKLFGAAIWVDASTRMPPEPVASCTVGPGDADYILDNNGGKLELRYNIEVMMHRLTKRGKSRGY